MAKSTSQVTAFVYGVNGVWWNGNGGVNMSFPVDFITMQKLSPPMTITVGTMNTKIKFLDGGITYDAAPVFYTDKDYNTLVNEANS